MQLSENVLQAAALARQPVAFKKYYYKRVLNPEKTFYWTEKTDGLRAVLIACDGQLFRMVKREPVLIDAAFPVQDTVVLDTEFYEGRYYVFDCYYLNRQFTEETLEERLSAVSEWLSGVKDEVLLLKQFHRISGPEDLNAASYYLSCEVSPASGCRIDGVIIEDNGPAAECMQYKWKRNRLITVDFLLKYEETAGDFLLYVMGDPAHCKPMRAVSLSERIEWNGITLCPVSTPLRAQIHRFVPREHWDRKDYRESESRAVEALMARALSEPETLDGKIVEMSPAEDGWVPLRLREDKQIPNSYKTAFDNILTYFEYPAFFETEQYYENSVSTQETVRVHEISRAMRTAQFEGLRQYLQAGTDSVLDIASGRGGDLELLLELGIRNIFGVDNVYNCAKYAIRANKDPHPCLLNLIPGYLGTDNTKILQDLQSRAEYPAGGFKLILMDYAIHYLLEIPDGMRHLRDFVKESAASGAVFLFTVFDGDRMMADADADGKLSFDSFSVRVNRADHTAMMVLPTIKHEEKKEKLFTEEDLKTLGFRLETAFEPLLKKSGSFPEEVRQSGLFRYYSYMKAYIVSVCDGI